MFLTPLIYAVALGRVFPRKRRPFNGFPCSLHFRQEFSGIMIWSRQNSVDRDSGFEAPGLSLTIQKKTPLSPGSAPRSKHAPDARSRRPLPRMYLWHAGGILPSHGVELDLALLCPAVTAVIPMPSSLTAAPRLPDADSPVTISRYTPEPDSLSSQLGVLFFGESTSRF